MVVKKDMRSRERDLLAVFDQIRRDDKPLRIQGLGNRQRESEIAGTPYVMTDWNSIVSYEPADLVVTAGAGMAVSALNELLAAHEQWIPLRVPDGKDDTLGGAVAAGVDGLWHGGYGPFRDRVLGLRVVTPGLGPIQLGSHVVKNVAGYNVSRLLIGTRGALGVITEVTLKVSPRPPMSWTWIWEGDLDTLIQRAESLRTLAWPWASLSFRFQKGSGIQLRAEWHGRRETIKHLVTTLGAGGPDLPLFSGTPWRDFDVVLKGAVPRRVMADFLRRVDDGLWVVEWQSGRLFGTASRSQSGRIGEWIRQQGGVLEVLSGPHVGLSTARVLPEAWQRLKAVYDPEGILG